MAYGVQPEGFVIKPLTQIRADIIARLVASPAVGPSQDYSDTDPLGQIVGCISSEVAEVWELGEAVHTSGDPEGTLGIPLDQLLSLTGSERVPARPSRMPCMLTLEAGAVVAAGALISITDRPEIQFSLDEEVITDGSPGDFPGEFTCTVDGPITFAADTPLTIDTAVSGWSAVTTSVGTIPGRLVANDIEYRQRWADERARSGSTTVGAIRAALLDSETTPEFVDIQKVLVLQNKTDEDDVNGLPPHSVEAIIDDGDVPTVDDDLIAQVLWDRGPAGGIETHGTESGTATDSEGNDQPMRFSRVTRFDVYINITVTTGSRFPVDGIAKVKLALVTAGADYDVSDDVIAEFIKSKAFEVAGVTDITDFAIGLAPGPTEDDNIPMGYRQRAVFDVDRVTVNGM